MKVKDCVAVVVGGASGLGEATVRKIAAAGGKVAILDLDESRGQAITEEIGANIGFFKTDVTDTESVQAALDVRWIASAGFMSRSIVPVWHHP